MNKIGYVFCLLFNHNILIIINIILVKKLNLLNKIGYVFYSVFITNRTLAKKLILLNKIGYLFYSVFTHITLILKKIIIIPSKVLIIKFNHLFNNIGYGFLKKIGYVFYLLFNQIIIKNRNFPKKTRIRKKNRLIIFHNIFSFFIAIFPTRYFK